MDYGSRRLTTDKKIGKKNDTDMKAKNKRLREKITKTKVK